jgi:hypothetical protein
LPAGDEYELEASGKPSVRNRAVDPPPPAALAVPTAAAVPPPRPVAAHVDLDATTDRLCVRCGATMGERDLACPSCKFSPMTGRYADDQERGDGEEGPQPWMSLMGIDFTTRRLAATAVMLLLMASGVVWYVNGPGAKLKVIESRTVTMFNAFEGIAVLEQGIPEVYGVGTGSDLLLSRSVPHGDKVMIRMHVAQSLLDAHDRRDRRAGRVMLLVSDFSVEVDGQRSMPTMLVRRVPAGAELLIGQSSTSDYRRILPPGGEPSNRVLEGPTMGEAVASGTVSYDGSAGITGQVNFMAYGLLSDMLVSGVTGNGQLKRVDPNGGEVVYDYHGGQLNITWSDEAEGWRTGGQRDPRAPMAPFTKHEVMLLFDRPTTGGRAKIFFADKHLASVRVRPMPAAEPVVASAEGDGEKQKEQEDLVDQINYLGAMARARNRARGLVSSSNMQQIGIALQLYSYEFRGQWPDTLEQLEAYHLPTLDQMLWNERTRENPGYIYVKPSDEDLRSKPLSQIPVLYESRGGQIDPSGSIVYADGHMDVR